MRYHGYESREAFDEALRSNCEAVRVAAKKLWDTLHQHCDHPYGICCEPRRELAYGDRSRV